MKDDVKNELIMLVTYSCDLFTVCNSRHGITRVRLFFAHGCVVAGGCVAVRVGVGQVGKGRSGMGVRVIERE